MLSQGLHYYLKLKSIAIYKLVYFTLAASLKKGITSLLTFSRFLRITFDEALMTSSGCGTPIILNFIPASYSIS